MNPGNIEHLGSNDIIMAGYPGSGAAWLGCLFVRLGIFYMDGYHEVFQDAVSHRTTILPISRRDRLPDYRDRDRNNVAFAEPIRVTKTHMDAAMLEAARDVRALVLVRDARDAIIAYYHWLRGFGGLTIGLSEFIRTGTQAEPLPPAQAWSNFYQGWMDALGPSKTHLVRFEDLRADPKGGVRRVLAFLEVERPEARLSEAIDECSYSAMRSKEENAVKLMEPESGTRMIMRRGQIGEWRTSLTAEDVRLVESQAGRTMRELGY